MLPRAHWKFLQGSVSRAALILLGSLTLLLSLSTSAQAGPGDWDHKGTYSVSYNGNLQAGKYATPVIYSGGGYFAFCVSNTSSSDYYYLYEYDPGSTRGGLDDYVSHAKLSNGGCAKRQVGHEVDGSNRKAELYVTTNTRSAKITFWD